MDDLYDEIKRRAFNLFDDQNLLAQPVCVRARVLTPEQAIGNPEAELSQGFVQMHVVIALCIGTLIGSQLGATLNARFPSPLLKLS